MKTKSNIAFLLLLLLITLSIVRAQDGTPTATLIPSGGTSTPSTPSAAPTAPAEPNPIEQCLKQCADDNLDCRAKCAGVPNPTEKQVNDTKTCLDACVPTDPTYLACRDSCINTYYNPVQTISSTSISSASAPTASTNPKTPSNSPKPSTASGNVATKTTPFGSFFAAFIVVFMSVCCF